MLIGLGAGGGQPREVQGQRSAQAQHGVEAGANTFVLQVLVELGFQVVALHLQQLPLGIRKGTLTLLLRRQAGLELQEARALLLRVLDEQPVTRELPAEAAVASLRAQAEALGGRGLGGGQARLAEHEYQGCQRQ